MEDSVKFEEMPLNMQYDVWAEDWERDMVKGQLTHIRNHPFVKAFINEGKQAVPYILNKLKENRLWYIPLEKIIYNEFNDEIVPINDIQEDKKQVNKTAIDEKFSFLEGYRVACLRWAEENDFLQNIK